MAIVVAVVESSVGVGSSDGREYVNDRRWRGMKSVWRKIVSSQM